jgi:alpha-L-fucosidase 2
MKAETKKLYGIDGIKFPGITNLTGEELGYLPCRSWQCVSAWMAQIFWWGYLYSEDVGFLKDTAYPMMREVAEFYRQYATLGEDRRYHIFPSTPPEQSPWWATDPAIDLALIRAHLNATIRASEILGTDEEQRARWHSFRQKLAPIPNNGEVFLDHRDAEPDCPLGHPALMSATWTAGLIGIDSPAEEYDMAVRTFRTLPSRTSRAVENYLLEIPTWNDDCAWPNMVGYAARLGLHQDALAYICDYGILQHLKPNGLFAFDTPLTEAQRETRRGMRGRKNEASSGNPAFR